MSRLRIPRPSHAVVVAYLALFVAMSGTAVAATGSPFILGKANKESQTSGLTSRHGAALKLTTTAGQPPLAVNRNAKVSNLNADLLDGLSSSSFLRVGGKATDADRVDGVDSTQLQRRVTASCAGAAIGSIGAAGDVTCRGLATTIVTSTIGNLGGSAQCAPGWNVVGGGYQFASLTDYASIRSYPTADIFGQYWNVYAENTASPYQVSGTVYAVCARLQ